MSPELSTEIGLFSTLTGLPVLPMAVAAKMPLAFCAVEVAVMPATFSMVMRLFTCCALVAIATGEAGGIGRRENAAVVKIDKAAWRIRIEVDRIGRAVARLGVYAGDGVGDAGEDRRRRGRRGQGNRSWRLPPSAQTDYRGETSRRAPCRAEASAGRTFADASPVPSPRVSSAYLPQGFQKNGRLD
jgi:hypothetical protein